MITCPNCKKELADGTKFCIGCGTNLETLKTVPKKMWAIGGGVLLAAVVIIVAVMVILGSAPKDKYAVYLKDGELYLSMLNGKDSIELTGKFVSGSDVSKDDTAVVLAGHLVKMSEDGKKVFYPEKLDTENYQYDLYYRNTTGNAEGERIAKKVTGYSISTDGKIVYYISEGTLYKHNLKEETEIEEDVKGCWLSEDCKNVLYMDADYDVYQMKDGKDAEKIAKNIELLHVSEDASKMFYKDQNGDLYLWEDGVEDATKIDESVDQLIAGYDNGGAYYVKVKTTTTTMADYIIDEYIASDAAMVKPVYPSSEDYVWPAYPEYPFSSDYDTYEEWEAAYAQYEIDCAKYEEDYDAIYAQYMADIDQYYIDDSAWSAKSDRDYYREYFDNYEYNVTSISLYYYDGASTKLVAENLNKEQFDDGYYCYLSDNQAPVMAYYVSQVGDVAKINISEITSLSSTNRLIKESLTTSAHFAVASGVESRVIEEKLVQNIYLAMDGKHVYYMPYTDGETSVLYEVSIDGTVSEGTEYDDEIGYVWGSLSNGKLVYFKDYDSDDDEGTLYIAKEKIEKDVYDMVVEVNGGEVLYFWTDSNGDEGNLCYYNGKELVEIQDDVSVLDYAVTEEGGIIYLVDYSHSKEEGELYYSVNGKEGKAIDEDVMTIISPME